MDVKSQGLTPVQYEFADRVLDDLITRSMGSTDPGCAMYMNNFPAETKSYKLLDKAFNFYDKIVEKLDTVKSAVYNLKTI